MIVASITGSITQAIGDHGIYAVFLLMAVDAVFPTASELVMVYAGALASGAIAGADLGPERLERAERWFDRWGDWAVFLGRLTPLVRSFCSIPAGVFRMPLGRYTVLTLAGSAIWCFGLAGIGYAIGSSWHNFHDGFRYVDYIVLALVLLLAGYAIWRWWSSRSTKRAAADLD